MSNCKLRFFSSLTKKEATDCGSYSTSARVDNKGGNIVLQLHGVDEDKESCDTAYFACFFPKAAATTAMKLLDACEDQGFDVGAFEREWLDRRKKKEKNRDGEVQVASHGDQ